MAPHRFLVCGSLASSAHEVASPLQALLKLTEDCGIQSLATICDYLKDGVEDPEIRGMLEDVLRASVRQTSLVLKQVRSALEGKDDR